MVFAPDFCLALTRIHLTVCSLLKLRQKIYQSSAMRYPSKAMACGAFGETFADCVPSPQRCTQLDGCQRGCSIQGPDRKSTRLNSSHRCISYAVFCLKKKTKKKNMKTE